MDKHFLQLQAYSTKNKAHEEIQNYVRQWHNAIVDDESLKTVLNAIEEEIARINAKYARCKDISLSINSYSANTIQYSVFENFYLVAHKVSREELSGDNLYTDARFEKDCDTMGKALGFRKEGGAECSRD